MSYFQARLAEVQIPPKKPQKYLFHVPRTKKSSHTSCMARLLYCGIRTGRQCLTTPDRALRRERIPSSPPPKSLENTTFLRLFSFLPGSAFDRFLLNISLVSRNFSSNRKSQKPLIHKGFRDFCSGRFLEIFFVCVIRTIFSMKTQIVFIFIATDLAFCPAQYNPICIEHRC